MFEDEVFLIRKVQTFSDSNSDSEYQFINADQLDTEI